MSALIKPPLPVWHRSGQRERDCARWQSDDRDLETLTCFSFMSRSPLLLMSALQELRGMINKQLWVLVLRAMIAVGVQNELRVRQVLLQDERVHRIDEHVVAAVHHECRLSDLLQVSKGIFRRGAPFL